MRGGNRGIRIHDSERVVTYRSPKVEAKADVDDLLVSAFAGENRTGTVVVLNRSLKPRRVHIVWPGMKFTQTELVDPYHENAVQKAPPALANGPTELIVDPGAVVTLTSTTLGR